LGILIKDVTTLETARNLSAVVFDKTGTLTTGELAVTRLQPVPGVDGADLLAAAASVEQMSRHPVARAVAQIAERARVRPSEPTEFREVAGQGVSGRVDGQVVLVGRRNWLAG
jgi:P-type E1-E2 ATPase